MNRQRITSSAARAVAALLVVFGSAALPPSAMAATYLYSAADDFSLSNPNGAWSYGYGSGPGWGWTDVWGGLLYAPGSGSGAVWWSINTYPYIEHNVSGGWLSGVIPPDQLFVVPADWPYFYSAIVRFTAPVTGDFDFSGDFIQLSGKEITPSWEGVRVTTGGNSGVVLAGSVGGYGYWGETVPIGFSEHLQSGDTVDFIVSANHNNWGDEIGLTLNVTGNDGAPEPATIWLAASALFCWAWRRSSSAGARGARSLPN